MSGPLGSASSPVLALSHVLWLPWVLVTNLSFQALHHWATYQQCPKSKELVRGQWQEPCCSLTSYIVCQAHEHPQPHPTACSVVAAGGQFLPFLTQSCHIQLVLFYGHHPHG